MKITDLKCAVIGKNPIVRIVTDEGISGFGQVEQYKPYLKPFILHFREPLIGEDPTNVERVMLRIRQRGAFKPWGSAVSAIEMALWDIAGKAAGLPVYKLLGGKVRDHVRVYNGALRMPLPGCEPEHYAEEARRMKALPEGFTMVKQGVAFHSPMKRDISDFFLGEPPTTVYHGALDTGLLTRRGMKGPAGHGGRDQSREGAALPGGRGRRLLRLSSTFRLAHPSCACGSAGAAPGRWR
jgi:L-alanine-DL-glutamate epimerase-like enolase superfamily enzyme